MAVDRKVPGIAAVKLNVGEAEGGLFIPSCRGCQKHLL